MARIFYKNIWQTFRYSDNITALQSPELRSCGRRRSPFWRSFRRQWIIQHPSCAACGRTWFLEAHHIVPINIDPDRELDPTNIITLCDDEDSLIRCHLKFGHLNDFWKQNPNVILDSASNLLKLKPWKP